MVLVKNRVKYFYFILSIKAANCKHSCKRFIRGSYNNYIKIQKRAQAALCVLKRPSRGYHQVHEREGV